MTDDIIVQRGDSKNIVVTYTDKCTGDPINLSGATVYVTAKPDKDNTDYDDSTAIFQKKITSHSIPESGQTVFSLGSVDTGSVGVYYWDTQVITAGNDVLSTAPGKFIVNNDITKVAVK